MLFLQIVNEFIVVKLMVNRMINKFLLCASSCLCRHLMHMHEGKRRILELSLWPFVEQSIEDLLHRLQAKLLITVQSLLIKIILHSG